MNEPLITITHCKSQYYEEGLNQYFNCRVTFQGITRDYALVEIDCDSGKANFYDSTEGLPVQTIQLFKAVKVAELPKLPEMPHIENLSCPSCGQPHLDQNEWAFRPHKTHLCLYCDHEFEGTIKAVSYPVVTVGYMQELGRMMNPETECEECKHLVSMGWQIIGVLPKPENCSVS